MDLSEKPENPECELSCNLRVLREQPIFDGLPQELLRVMAYLCERETFAQGQAVLEEGGTAETAVIVFEGSLAVEREGKRLGLLGQGMLAGGLALLGGFRSLYTLRAEAGTVCLLLHRRKLLPQLLAQPEALATVARGLVDGVLAWDAQRLERGADADAVGPGAL